MIIITDNKPISERLPCKNSENKNYFDFFRIKNHFSPPKNFLPIQVLNKEKLTSKDHAIKRITIESKASNCFIKHRSYIYRIKGNIHTIIAHLRY